MDVDLLAQLVSLMTAHDLNTLEVRDGQRRVILKRGLPGAPVQVIQAPAAVSPSPPGAPAVSGAAPANPGGELEPQVARIVSPMVGTFYAAPKPGEKPLVTVGSEVTEDTDVCLIEAMKNFMPIKADCRGTIARVLASDGQPVEFGTVLFLVKPS